LSLIAILSAVTLSLSGIFGSAFASSKHFTIPYLPLIAAVPILVLHLESFKSMFSGLNSM